MTPSRHLQDAGTAQGPRFPLSDRSSPLLSPLAPSQIPAGAPQPLRGKRRNTAAPPSLRDSALVVCRPVDALWRLVAAEEKGDGMAGHDMRRRDLSCWPRLSGWAERHHRLASSNQPPALLFVARQGPGGRGPWSGPSLLTLARAEQMQPSVVQNNHSQLCACQARLPRSLQKVPCHASERRDSRA